jgi:redox-regulated HSP33 family molecular chaperone
MKKEEKEQVYAEPDTSYSCECPVCSETHYLGWEEETEAVHGWVEIKCDECETKYDVTI